MRHFSLTSFHLKLIAIVTMTIDHIGYYLIPYTDDTYMIYRLIGRIAFILFAFMVSEAMHFTRHPWRYIAILAVLGIAFDSVVYWITGDQIGNIFLTLAIGALSIKLLSYRRWWSLLAIAFVTFAWWAPFIGINFYYDYGVYGVLLMVLLYFTRHDRMYQMVVILLINIGFYLVDPNQWGFQSYSIIAIPFLLAYNGKPGFRHPLVKYAFYAYYPLHIMILYGLSQWL